MILPKDIQRAARKSFRQWRESPFHPSLHFKCVNHEDRIWSVRLTLGYRALGIMEGDTVTWFWVGSHEDYARRF